jgi:hypothetical protein
MWVHVLLFPPASEDEKEAAKLQGTWLNVPGTTTQICTKSET